MDSSLESQVELTDISMEDLVDYETVKSTLSDESIMFIDTRPSHMKNSHGYLTETEYFNVPGRKMEEALDMNEDQFYAAYGFEKPKVGDKITTYCQVGINCKIAYDALKAKGYKNVKWYQGSMK